MKRRMKDVAIQRDWVQEILDGREITSAEMQLYVNRLNKVDPKMGESKQMFTATDVALVLFDTKDTKGVYALCEGGAIGYSSIGTGKDKRKYSFSRHAIYKFLADRCKDAGQL